VPGPGTFSSLSRRARSAFASIAGVSGLLALIAVFWALEPDTFGTVDNFKLIVSQASVAAILAAGLSVSLTAGAFDLSFGAVMAGGGVLVAGLLTNAGVGPLPAIVLTILAGVAFGAVNGLLVAYGRLPSLIATLGTQSVLAGILVWATSSVAVSIDTDSSFNQIARGDWLGVPREAWIMLVLVSIGWAVSRQTIVGRNLTAVGRNPDAAHLAGIPVRRYVVGALAVTAAFAACAGILTAAKLSAGRPEVGAALLLPTVAAAFLGAAVSRDGAFNMPGAVLGALMLTTITNGLVIVSAPDWTYEVVTGVVLLLAVGLSRLVRHGAAPSGAP
jgi:ribose transport system permease protein